MNDLFLAIVLFTGSSNTNFYPGAYEITDIAIVYINSDSTWEIAAQTCVGTYKIDGRWHHDADTILLKDSDRIIERLIIDEHGFPRSVYMPDSLSERSDHSFINDTEAVSPFPLKCYYNKYNNGRFKTSLIQTNNRDTQLVAGYYENGLLHYITNFDYWGKPIGTWYLFDNYGSIIKTKTYIDQTPDTKKKKRRHLNRH